MPPHETNYSQTLSRTDEQIDVLHVDDDKSLVEVSADFLEQQNDFLSVDTELSPSDALEYLEENNVDCIVSDYDMPRKNGLELLQLVRERYPNLPFILYTGKGSEQIASEAISKGVTDYLQKQTGAEQYELLANRIRNAVEQHRASQRAQQIERWLRELAEETKNVLWIFSGDMDEVIFVNSTFEDLFGIPTEQLRENPQQFLEVVHPDDRTQVEQTIERLQAGQSAEIQHRVNGRNDDSRWVYVRAQPVLNDDDGVARIVGITTEITERKKREQQLRLFRRVIESSGHSIYFTDQNGVIEYVNEAFEEMTGYTAEEAIGRTPQILQSGEHDPEFYADLWTTILDGDVWRNEVFNERKDGTQYFIDQTIAPVTNKTGKITHFVAVNVDISEQKAYEKQLQEEQQFVQSIFEALPDPLYAFDTEGQLIRWNDQLEEITGYTSDEIKGKHLTEFTPEEEHETTITSFQTILEEQRPVTVESPIKTKEDNSILFELTGGPLVNSTGELQGITGIGRNITDRKKLEQQLTALNETAQDVMTTDTRQEVAEIAIHAARDVLGLNANAVHLYDDEQNGLVPTAQTEEGNTLVGSPPTLTENHSIAWRVYTSGETLALDDVKNDPDVYNPETAVQSELYLPLGEHGIFLAASKEPQAFDEQDRILGEILAGTITAAFEQVEHSEQLRSREQELARQNKRLEEFANFVSHDLRNPLNVAELHLELATEDWNSEHLATVKQQHDRMEKLIEDLLTVAHTGQTVRELESVCLGELAEQCWGNVVTEAATLERDIDRPIRADRTRLQQLLENVFRNAVEHGDEKVTVRVGLLPDGFFIADDGPGIAPEERESVFESGYSTTRDGTGFGLAIVKGVVEAHDWEITVTESEDGGARFEFTSVEPAEYSSH